MVRRVNKKYRYSAVLKTFVGVDDAPNETTTQWAVVDRFEDAVVKYCKSRDEARRLARSMNGRAVTSGQAKQLNDLLQEALKRG